MIQIDIPMPESCKKCPIPWWDGEDLICTINPYRDRVSNTNDCRDDCCPLEEVRNERL